jgi:hypothetical protein
MFYPGTLDVETASILQGLPEVPRTGPTFYNYIEYRCKQGANCQIPAMPARLVRWCSAPQPTLTCCKGHDRQLATIGFQWFVAPHSSPQTYVCVYVFACRPQKHTPKIPAGVQGTAVPCEAASRVCGGDRQKLTVGTCWNSDAQSDSTRYS